MPESGERHLAQELRGGGAERVRHASSWKDASEKAPTFGQRSKLSMQEQRQKSPIYKLKYELIEAVRQNQVLVVIGETGSGKTTPDDLQSRPPKRGTPPRERSGARSQGEWLRCQWAKRVAEEFGCRLGEEVGYAIRFRRWIQSRNGDQVHDRWDAAARRFWWTRTWSPQPNRDAG